MTARFGFSHQALDLAALRASVADVANGGYASFEGWVRNHNEGIAVTSLEYEAFEQLAIKEGERIVAEACDRFGVTVARCVHRVGALALGDVAVWVGVSAHHRDEAFRACRYIIDEVKHRVPIWKKEHYVTGDSGWVNCERCAAAATVTAGAAAMASESHDHTHHDHDHDHAHHEHSATAAGRTAAGLVPDYSRQMTLREVGPAGQAKLTASHVAVVGAGGLGVPVLQFLAGAGVGRLTIIDGDRLEPSNLHRQTWYALAESGELKAELAAQRVRALNPAVHVTAHAERLDALNGARLLAGADLVLDCSDNFSTKFLLNDLMHELGVPVLLASVYQFEGQLQWLRPAPTAACLRCVWPDATRDGLVGNCAEAGVLGPVPGVLGSLQALQALQWLLGLIDDDLDAVTMIDLRSLAITRVRARRRADCTPGTCAPSKHALARCRAPQADDLEREYAALAAARAAGLVIIDIRESAERDASPLSDPGVIAVPMSELLDGRNLPADGRYLLVCARGLRSLAAARQLRDRGLVNVWSLRGGAQALMGLA